MRLSRRSPGNRVRQSGLKKPFPVPEHKCSQRSAFGSAYAAFYVELELERVALADVQTQAQRATLEEELSAAIRRQHSAYWEKTGLVNAAWLHNPAPVFRLVSIAYVPLDAARCGRVRCSREE